jgi:hypothetical protein
MSILNKIKSNLRKFLPKGHALGKRYGHSKRRRHHKR